MSLDKTLKAIGLRKKTPADKVREAGANLNARFAKLRGATPESRARAAGARFGLDRRPVVLAALWVFAALPWFNARWTGSVTPAGLAPLVGRDVAAGRLRGVRAEANRAPRPLAPAERRGARGAARAQRLQDAGGAARGPVLGRPI